MKTPVEALSPGLTVSGELRIQEEVEWDPNPIGLVSSSQLILCSSVHHAEVT